MVCRIIEPKLNTWRQKFGNLIADQIDRWLKVELRDKPLLHTVDNG